MQMLCLLPVFLFISCGFTIQYFIFLLSNKWDIESKIGFSKFCSHGLNFKDRNLQESSLHLLASNYSKLFKILVYPSVMP